MAGSVELSASAGNRPRGRRTKDMPDGRQALLQAATRAFAKNGFDGADIRSIAAEAAVSPNLVRVHFGSKAELWEACLDVIVAAALPTIAEVAELAADPERALYDRLRDIILRTAAFYAAHPGVREFITRPGSESAERVTMLNDRLMRPAYDTARALFEAGISAGIIRSNHPALFFALLNGAVSQQPTFAILLSRLAPEIDAAEARDRMIETVVATLLHRPPHLPARQAGSPTSE